jgi:hypothetical protein
MCEECPAVSVLLPTTQSWPAVSEALASVLSQAGAPPFEVLVLDGHGEALSEVPGNAAVRWIRLPGHDSFALRAAGIARARGSIIAITEDHCTVPPGWVASIVDAHRNDSSPAIVGAVYNDPASTASAADRANFILTFARQTPNRLRLGDRLPVPTNLSFKREALRSPLLAPGELEYEWLAELLFRKSIGTSESVVLHHKQRWGKATWRVHIASGRSYGAAVCKASMRTRIGWWMRFPLAPLRMIRLVFPELLRGAAGKPVALSDLLCTATLIAANFCGQGLGALFGAGTSRGRL